jgi:hypothetical protein
MTATADKPDLAEFYKLTRRGKRKPCLVRPVLDALGKGEREQFEAACREDAGIISNQALHLWLESHGKDRWTGAWQHALSHRDGKCSCADA